MKSLRALAVFPLLALATACIMPDQLAEYQKQVADVQQALEAVKKTQAELNQQVVDLQTRSGTDEPVKRSDLGANAGSKAEHYGGVWAGVKA